MKRKVEKPRKLPLVISILAVLLGTIALLIGWMGYGGYMFGIPAILLAIYSYLRGHKILAGIAIIFSCIGIAESFAASVFVASLQQSTTPKAVSAKIGRTVDIDGFDFTVNSIKQSDVYIDYSNILNDYKAVSPKPGYKFVEVKITVKSKKKEESLLSKLINLTLITDKGYLYTSAYVDRYQTGRNVRDATTYEIDNYYCKKFDEFEKIPPGETSEGCLFFEILKTANPIKLEFQTDIIGGKTVSIDLTG
jgi:hypothetical protein